MIEKEDIMNKKIKILEQAIELAKRNVTIYINSFMITNSSYGMDKDIEINYDELPTLDIIVNGIIEFSIPIGRITSIETIDEVLYRE